MRSSFAFAALAAITAVAAPSAALAAPVGATGEARGLIIQPLAFVNVEALDFGTVVASNVPGSVTIDPGTGIRSTVGGVTGAPSAPGGRGLFQGLGTAGQQVLLSYNAPLQLNHATFVGQAVAFRDFTLDGATTRTIGVGGTFQVGVGATIDLAANQLPGLYSAQFEVTADYQ